MHLHHMTFTISAKEKTMRTLQNCLIIQHIGSLSSIINVGSLYKHIGSLSSVINVVEYLCVLSDYQYELHIVHVKHILFNSSKVFKNTLPGPHC